MMKPLLLLLNPFSIRPGMRALLFATLALCLAFEEASAQCTLFNVTGGGTICAGAAGLTISLSGSTSGVSYQLKNGATNVGAAKNGTGAALSWTGNTAAGTYTVVATKSTAPTCSATMNGSAVIVVNAVPSNAPSVGGGGTICSGATGPSITLSTSFSGVNYQLKRGATNVGSALAGTGSLLTWTNNATAGTYTVVATDATTGCTATMTGNAVVVVNTLPNAATVTGTGSYCAGGSGLTISLSASQTGVNYQLLLGGANVGAPLAGTGSPLNWINVTAGGTYTVVGTNATTSCQRTMTSSAIITVVPIPTAFSVTGGGSMCTGATGLTIGLSGSTTGVNYQLKNGGTNVGAAKAGTGAALSWTNNATAGTYTISAASATNATCSATMTGSAIIVVNPLPTLYNVSGTGSICAGSPGLTVALSGSSTGINYQLKRGSTLVGSAIAGTGSSLSWPNNTTAGTYTVTATNATTSCTATMTGSAVITVNAIPTAFTVGGGGAYCSGGTGVSITLSSSTVGVNYQLRLSGVNLGLPVAGTGALITWSNITGAGTYTVFATNASTGCTNTMASSKTVTINPLPTQFNVSGGSTCVAATGSIVVGLSGSQTGINYQLKLNGANSGAVKAGTNSALSWGTLTSSGTYTVVATNATTSCSQTMVGSAGIYIIPTAFTITGGGEYCTGTGLTLTLNGSQAGTSYQLKIDGTNTGSPIAGTGLSIAWPDQKVAGTYTVTAFTPNCTAGMSGNTIITVNAVCNALDNWAYRYKYDDRHRMVQKKVPGADWTFMVYDGNDRLIFTQDAQQRTLNQWYYTEYDWLDRPVITGIYTHPSTIDQATMTSLIANTSFTESYNGVAPHGYSQAAFATANFAAGSTQVLTVTYYDSYSFMSLLNDARFNYEKNDFPGEQYTYDVNGGSNPDVKGEVTGSKVNILGQSTFLWNVNYYDDRYRTIQAISSNNLSGIDRATNVFDFAGKVKKSKLTHVATVNSVLTTNTVTRTLDYDHAGRLRQTTHQVNGGPAVVLSGGEYNALGQLVDKKLYSEDNGSTFAQSVDYRYNIRGWVESINNPQLTPDPSNDDSNDLFGMKILYNNVDTDVNNSPEFNGSISGTQWSRYAGYRYAYNYYYDTLDRIRQADFFKDSLATWSAPNSFRESGYRYDLNGNIKSLVRRNSAGAVMDNLTFDYGSADVKSNQLLAITDTGTSAGFIDGNTGSTDYTYDKNGNMTVDKNKSITGISYNYLNLARQVTKNTGEYVKYTYDATGRKLKQEVFSSTGVLKKKSDYSGDYFYENDTLKFISHEEGRILMTTATPEYQYYLKDHLGSVRTTFTTKPGTQSSVATLETANAGSEQAAFLNYSEAVKLNSPLFDHSHRTPQGAGNTTFYSTRLSGATTNEKIGLAKSISVLPGDHITIEVFAKYLDPVSSNWSVPLTNFLASIQPGGGAPANTFIDGGLPGSLGSNIFPFASIFLRTNDTGTGPKAYLNYIVFDQNFIPLDMGFRRLSATPRENGQDIAPERLAVEGSNITISKAGYVYTWISNENDTPLEVYFDDFKVVQTNSPVIQVQDYYPYGLPFNEHLRDNNLVNNFQFNGKERQEELSIGWLDYGARMYMPEIGRWGAVDPLTQLSRRWSPYSYTYDNPVRFIDVDGMYPDDDLILAQIEKDEQDKEEPRGADNLNNEEWLEQFHLVETELDEEEEEEEEPEGEGVEIHDEMEEERDSPDFDGPVSSNLNFVSIDPVSIDPATYRWFDTGAGCRASFVSQLLFFNHHEDRPLLSSGVTMNLSLVIQLPESVTMLEKNKGVKEFISPNEASRILSKSIDAARILTSSSFRAASPDAAGMQSDLTRLFQQQLQKQLSARFPGSTVKVN